MDAAVEYVLRSPFALFGAIGVGMAVLVFLMSRKWFAVPALGLLGVVLVAGGLYGAIAEGAWESLAALAFGLGFLFFAWRTARRPQGEADTPDAEQFGRDLENLLDPD
jgi:hypothetical protein